MKKTSCGVIIYNEYYEMLGCIPYGKKDKLDIPKGIKEENETYMQTVIRETYEETGIRLSKNKLNYIGKYKYSSNKDLCIFSYKYNFNISSLKCISTFEFYGKEVPEIIGYKSIDMFDENKIKHNFYKSLGTLLVNIIKEKIL